MDYFYRQYYASLHKNAISPETSALYGRPNVHSIVPSMLEWLGGIPGDDGIIESKGMFLTSSPQSHVQQHHSMMSHVESATTIPNIYGEGDCADPATRTKHDTATDQRMAHSLESGDGGFLDNFHGSTTPPLPDDLIITVSNNDNDVGSYRDTPVGTVLQGLPVVEANDTPHLRYDATPRRSPIRRKEGGGFYDVEIPRTRSRDRSNASSRSPDNRDVTSEQNNTDRDYYDAIPATMRQERIVDGFDDIPSSRNEPTSIRSPIRLNAVGGFSDMTESRPRSRERSTDHSRSRSRSPSYGMTRSDREAGRYSEETSAVHTRTRYYPMNRIEHSRCPADRQPLQPVPINRDSVMPVELGKTNRENRLRNVSRSSPISRRSEYTHRERSYRKTTSRSSHSRESRFVRREEQSSYRPRHQKWTNDPPSRRDHQQTTHLDSNIGTNTHSNLNDRQEHRTHNYDDRGRNCRRRNYSQCRDDGRGREVRCSTKSRRRSRSLSKGGSTRRISNRRRSRSRNSSGRSYRSDSTRSTDREGSRPLSPSECPPISSNTEAGTIKGTDARDGLVSSEEIVLPSVGVEMGDSIPYDFEEGEITEELLPQAERNDDQVLCTRSKPTTLFYEEKARLAITEGDKAELSECLKQLNSFYTNGNRGHVKEFTAYRILYSSLTDHNLDIPAELSQYPPSVQNSGMIRHAVAVRRANTSSDHRKFFQLYKHSQKLSGKLIDMFIERHRRAAVNEMIRELGYDDLPVEFIRDELAFENLEDCSNFLTTGLFMTRNEISANSTGSE